MPRTGTAARWAQTVNSSFGVSRTLRPQWPECLILRPDGIMARDNYNHGRYHESLRNVTPADMYDGRQREILTKRERIKRETLAQRRKENLRNAA